MHWKLAIFAVVALLPAVLLNPHKVLDVVNPIDAAAVTVEPVDVGQVRPGERCHARVALRNATLRTIELAGVKTDCGCVVVHGSPAEIGPREVRQIELSMTTPIRPGAFRATLP